MAWLADTHQELHSQSKNLPDHSKSHISLRKTRSARSTQHNTEPNSETDSRASLLGLSSAAASVDDPRPGSRASVVDLSGNPISTDGSDRSEMALVKSSTYRVMNLAQNHIYYLDPMKEFPEYIEELVRFVSSDRDSPGPPPDLTTQINDVHDLVTGSSKFDVKTYFHKGIFPNLPKSDLKLVESFPMSREAVPNVGSKLRVSTPVPDILYGYERGIEFSQQQQAQLIEMGTEMIANSHDAIYPFFVIEFKGDGPGGTGSMWVATNQCLGGAASCVKIAESLNRRLEDEEFQPINSAAFSVAMNGEIARLYISWLHDDGLTYYMKSVAHFALENPVAHLMFQKYVLNIIDWGKGKRLKEIRDSLDRLRGESGGTDSEAEKPR